MARVVEAIEELRVAGWLDDIELIAYGGPNSYLYGEETGLLEVLDGREPFPRVAPPWRHGVDEVGDGTESAADLELAEPGGEGIAPPTLANNCETLANVPRILADGVDTFREYGTEQSPGTLVCTVSGATPARGRRRDPDGHDVARRDQRDRRWRRGRSRDRRGAVAAWPTRSSPRPRSTRR